MSNIDNIIYGNMISESININEFSNLFLTKNIRNEIIKKEQEVLKEELKTELVIETSKTEIIDEKNELIEPYQKDSLFWCIYIIVHGYNDYNNIIRNYGVRQLEEKQKIFEYIKENKLNIKNTNYKITNVSISEMMSEFITVHKETSILCLIAMVVYYNINIIIVDLDNHTMLEFWSNKEEIPNHNNDYKRNTYVLYKRKNGKYKLRIENITTTKISEMRDEYIVLESYNKPLKSISSYKVNELEIMIKKLGICMEEKKYKKNELYEMIEQKINSY